MKLYFPRWRSRSRQRSKYTIALMIFTLFISLTMIDIAVASATVSMSPISSENVRECWTQNVQLRIPKDSNKRKIAETYNNRKQRIFPKILPMNHDVKDIVQEISRRGQMTLTRSISALRVTAKRIDSINGERQTLWKDTLAETVQVNIIGKTRIRNILDFQKPGFYYGINPDTMMPKKKDDRNRPPKLKDTMIEALEELKIIRQEMERMRVEMEQLKRKLVGEDDDRNIDEYSSEEAKAKGMMIRRKRKKEAEKLAEEIESWAHKILQEGEEDGWKRLECNKMVRASVNRMERTTAYMKWMPDSRGEKADKEDRGKYPCIKCYSTIDAPLEEVCTYLSQPDKSVEYNDVVEKHKDLEEISPSAKICWSQSPQILFVKPRDFVTFCHHRWKSDGTEIIVNQACEHPKYPSEEMEKDGKSCRGYALRGVNILSRCSEDPSKTNIAIVAHANPGRGLPEWATKAAVNALAPIEPFKLFHKINEKVIHNQPQLRERVEEAKTVSTMSPSGRSSRPGGISQLGYACFWPDGGGKIESIAIPLQQPRDMPTNQAKNDSDSSEDRENNDVEGSSAVEINEVEPIYR